jgi:DNA-binding response OmpR family regulator
MNRILITEDEPRIATLLEKGLQAKDSQPLLLATVMRL